MSTMALAPIDLTLKRTIALSVDDVPGEKNKIAFVKNTAQADRQAIWDRRNVTVIDKLSLGQRFCQLMRRAGGFISQAWGSAYRPRWVPVLIRNIPDYSKPFSECEREKPRQVFMDSDEFFKQFKTEWAERRDGAYDVEIPLYNPMTNKDPIEMTRYFQEFLQDKFYKKPE